MSDESVVLRIKKLLALSLNNSNPAEAAAAMTKARELMVQHMVDEAHLRGADTPTGTAIYEFRNNRKFQSWMEVTFIAVSKLFDASLIVSEGRELDTAIFVCADYDLELLKETVLYSIATILREAAVQCRGLAAANSFRAGAAQGFLEKATKLQQEARVAETANSGSEVTGLVHLKQNAIQTAIKEKFPNLRNSSVRVSVSDATAYYAGKAVGNDLGKKQNKIE